MPAPGFPTGRGRAPEPTPSSQWARKRARGQPRVPNFTARGRGKNRRIEIYHEAPAQDRNKDKSMAIGTVGLTSHVVTAPTQVSVTIPVGRFVPVRLTHSNGRFVERRYRIAKPAGLPPLEANQIALSRAARLGCPEAARSGVANVQESDSECKSESSWPLLFAPTTYQKKANRPYK